MNANKLTVVHTRTLEPLLSTLLVFLRSFLNSILFRDLVSLIVQPESVTSNLFVEWVLSVFHNQELIERRYFESIELRHDGN